MADRVDQERIETQIEIVRQSIKRWQGVLERPDAWKELADQARYNISREEINLQKLKNKYPEYFI